MAWKHEYIFLRYHWNLNISELLQGVLHVNNILELLLKYHFHTFMTSSISFRSNPGARGEHLTIQLLWAAAQLSVTRFKPWLPSGWALLPGNKNVVLIQDYILYLFLVWIRRNKREEDSKIPLCNPSGWNLLLRQSRPRNSVKHQRRSSSAKTANSLDMLIVSSKRLHQRPPTGMQVCIWQDVLWVWVVGGLLVHGIRIRRLVQKEVVKVGSNYKRSYFWWRGNPASGDSTESNRTEKSQGCVSAGLVWGKGREGAVWLSACGVTSDHQVNGDYVDVSLTCCECGLGSTGRWPYSKEWVWNLETKIVLKWNFSTMTFQEFNVRYILL